MRYIDADVLKEKILAERDKIPLETVERYSFGVPTPYRHGQSMRGGIRVALRCMEGTPTVDAAPVVHGEWKSCRFKDDLYQEQCSVCEGWSHDIGNYCSSCGAKMFGD